MIRNKRIAEKIDITDVTPFTQKEIDLVYLIRNVYRYGKIEIEIIDGVPRDVIRTVERVRLGGLSTEEVDRLL